MNHHYIKMTVTENVLEEAPSSSLLRHLLRRSQTWMYLAGLLVAIFLISAILSIGPSYDTVEYVPVTVEQGDTAYDLIQKVNASYEEVYDVRRLLPLMEKKNDVSRHDIPSGVTLDIPRIVE